MKKINLLPAIALLLGSLTTINASAQNAGNLSGDLMVNANFFQRDTSIKASGNQLYDNYLSGGESWLALRYSNYGFNGFLRLDVFNNSNLKNPTQAYSGFGIGAWNVSKEYKGLTITGGYIYDQIGSGIIFRAYEDRGLQIDNALKGVRLNYKINNNIFIKAFTGQEKNLFSQYAPIIKGVNGEGNFSLSKSVFITPGIGIVNRTIDQDNMTSVVNNINSLPVEQRFVPVYNNYAFTAYNTLSAGDFTWYVEGAYKTKEAIGDYNGNLEDKDGSVLYSTLGYARKGFALNISGKRTQNFVMRTSPNQTLLDGRINWQPTIAQINPQRLIARYTPPSQDLSEMALNANMMLSPSEDYDFNLSYTHINTLEGLKLYREILAQANIRSVAQTYIDLGLHIMQYNQDYYQFKPGVPIIKAVTPFAEITYLINQKQSIKLDAQYMATKQDYGSWLYLGLEYAIAPKLSFALSDMYNIKPAAEGETKKHYYNAFVAYTKGSNRFTIAYVKQVDGINCTGGVCRYEPAFSGVKLGITSSF